MSDIKTRSSIVFLILCSLIIASLNVAAVSAVNGFLEPIRINNPEPQADALFGDAAARISDIDGDGIGDLAVGANGMDRVYVFSGIDQSIIYEIGDPDGFSGYLFGYAVSGVGDLDGDGVEDIAVGAPGPWGFPTPPLPGQTEPPPDWGRVFVFSGATGGLILRIIPVTGGWGTTTKFGFSLASLGDVNGDGINDIIVGAPVGMAGLGSVLAYSGDDGSLIWSSREPSPSDWDIAQTLASFGLFLADISDLTGDGLRDLLVAAPYSDYDGSRNRELLAGKGYILDGSDGTIFRTHDNPTPVDRDKFGVGPAAIGDQDRDGVEDYAFGELGAAIVHLFSGASGNSIRDISSPSSASNDLFGFKTVVDGDRDADGLNDFWVAAPSRNATIEGIVYLMNSAGDILGQVNDPNPDSLVEQGGFGQELLLTDDLDGDGTRDLLIGKPRESVDGFEQAGAVFLVFHDSEPPTIVAEIPSEGQTVQNDVTFTATVSDPSGVEWVKFSIREPNGELGTIIDPIFESMPVDNAGDDTYELLFDTTQLLDGRYLLLINASDTYGNEGNVVVEFFVQNWAFLPLLPPSQGNKAGRTMPIKFSLRVAEAVDPNQPFVWNEELSIIIYEEGHPNVILQNSTYGEFARDYRIDSENELYVTNFLTLNTPKTYVVEIYRKSMLISNFMFSTT